MSELAAHVDDAVPRSEIAQPAQRKVRTVREVAQPTAVRATLSPAVSAVVTPAKATPEVRSICGCRLLCAALDCSSSPLLPCLCSSPLTIATHGVRTGGTGMGGQSWRRRRRLIWTATTVPTPSPHTAASGRQRGERKAAAAAGRSRPLSGGAGIELPAEPGAAHWGAGQPARGKPQQQQQQQQQRRRRRRGRRRRRKQRRRRRQR